MAQLLRPPRLWLRPERTLSNGQFRKATWTILDSGRHIATGRGPDEEADAQALLADYIARNYPDGVPSPVPMEAPKLPSADRTKIVYFVTTGEVPSFPIKIGVSSRSGFRYRLGALQVGCPYALAPLAAINGDEDDEGDWHDAFSHLAMRGEWFARAPDLLAAIRRASDHEPDPLHGFNPAILEGREVALPTPSRHSR